MQQSLDDLKEKIKNSKDMFPDPIIGELKKRTSLNYLQVLKIQLEDMNLDEHSQIPMKIIINLSALNLKEISFNFKLLSNLGHRFKDNYLQISLPTHVNFIFVSSQQILNQFVVLLKSYEDINSVIKAVHQSLFFKFKLAILRLDDQNQKQQINEKKYEQMKKLQSFVHHMRAYGLQVINWKRQPSQVGRFLKKYTKNIYKKIPTIKDLNLLPIKLQNLYDYFQSYYRKNLHIFILRRLGSVFSSKISKLKSISLDVEQFKEQVRQIKQNKLIKNSLTQILSSPEDQIVLKFLVDFFHAQLYYEPIKQRKKVAIKYEEQRKQEDIKKREINKSQHRKSQ